MRRGLWIAMVLSAVLGASVIGATPAAACECGCTPGFWKQEQHDRFWPAHVYGWELFGDYFTDAKGTAIGAMKLDEVLAQGGGGLDALGRHTVAALLNAWSFPACYPMDKYEVKAAFNAVFPGTKSQYNAVKDMFESWNEAGCPY